ncbi:hypothetical protein [Kineosporia sp. R_H_3]|uniref:hypothetical protein n=1 Tax=Kineosporia sp. R_H_3 TaxID=1961848 RepID=UPI00117B2557|nr:hypothetical protein [Kineosporia sp. R_H_3]
MRLTDDGGLYRTEVAIYPPSVPLAQPGRQREWASVINAVLRATDYARLTHEMGRWHIDHAHHAGTTIQANDFPVLELRFAAFPGIVRPQG